MKYVFSKFSIHPNILVIKVLHVMIEMKKLCELLKSLEDLHGDSCIKNLQAIKKMNIDTRLENLKRYWFGTKIDD